MQRDDEATVTIRFKDLNPNEDTREHLEQRCRQISEEFPETTHYELNLAPDATNISASAHVGGKGIDLAAHAATEDLRASGELALDKLERELRREHDKKIFGHRRSAQKDAARKRG